MNKPLAAFSLLLTILAFQNCGKVAKSDITTELREELSVPTSSTTTLAPNPAPVGAKLRLNIAFDGKGTERELSPFVGPLAVGADTDIWNSAGKAEWPLTALAKDNTRGNLKTAEGDLLPDVTLRVFNLGQQWSNDSQFGIRLLPMISYLYTDSLNPGLITLDHLPAGKYEVLLYAPPSEVYPNQFHVRILTSDDSLFYRTVTKNTSTISADSKLTVFLEDVQFVRFEVDLESGQKLQISTGGTKKAISAAQINLLP